jgi:glycerol-3-phosphate acyltransferase PlsY
MMLAILILLGYLLGSLSGSLMLGKLRGVDIRTQGSGNAGGTNAFRTQGALFALGVVAIDIGKGALAAWLGARFGAAPVLADPAAALLCGSAAALGHVWPVFHGFRGGKGAGTLVGVIAVVFPIALVPLLVAWIFTLTSTGYVGLSTVLAGALLPVAAALLAEPEREAALLTFGILVAAFLVFTHRANLVRLARGTEHRFERARLFRRRSP